MKTVTPTELRKDIYKLLDEIIKTGVPLEIDRGGQMLRITAVQPVNKLDVLVHRPEVVVGDPADLVEVSWEEELDLDLP